MAEEKRKRTPILATIRRAISLVIKAGRAKHLVTIAVWSLVSAVVSFTAVFNEKFINAAAELMGGNPAAIKTALLWLAVWAVVEILIAVLNMVNERILSVMWEEISFFVQKVIMEKCLKIRLKYFDDRESQKKIRFLKNGAKGYFSSVIQAAISIIPAMITFTTSLIILVNANWIIALIVVVCSIPSILIERAKTDKTYDMNQWKSYEGQMQRYMALVLTKRKYIKEMRFYQLYDYMQEKYDKSVKELDKQQMKLAKTFLFAGIGTSLFTYGSIAVSLIIISAEIFAGNAEIGAFALVYSSVQVIQNAVTNMFGQLNVIGDQGRYLEDYETVMAFEEEEYLGTDEIAPLEIRFEHVSFSYPGMGREVLRDINLTIHPGEKIAVVGENGSGKSTFVSLLTGLYSPTKGEIYVNGKPLETQLGLLRNSMSSTMQQFYQFMDSVEENVRIGDLRTAHEKSDVTKALKKAGLLEDVNALENGQETYLGTLYENSIDLSGGQWQKLAMARNLYKEKATLMLMDEPTAALDPIAESRLYQEFSNLTQDKTVLLISHRLGATRLANRVLVFDDGQIAEDGVHEELLKAGGLYKRMYEAQAQWYV